MDNIHKGGESDAIPHRYPVSRFAVDSSLRGVRAKADVGAGSAIIHILSGLPVQVVVATSAE
jgi:hypothetical protein